MDVLSGVMAVKLALNDQDRDLVVMRHIFKIHDPKDGSTWDHTSTMVASGDSKRSGGHSIMSTTVGITCGIATRMILEGKIAHRGILSPIHQDIYDPMLSELQKRGIEMIEESSSAKGLAKLEQKQAKM